MLEAKGSDAFKTIRVLPFSGKEEDWNRWSKTFLSTVTSRVYLEVPKPINKKVTGWPGKEHKCIQRFDVGLPR